MLWMTQHHHQMMMMTEDVDAVLFAVVEMTQQLGHDFDFAAVDETTPWKKKKMMMRMRSHPHW